MLWLAIEGTDGVGKTTICGQVADLLQISGYTTFLVNEFSDSLLGKFLSEVIESRRYLAFNDGAPSLAVAESLCLVADLAAKFQLGSYGSHDFVLSDRGTISILGYQAVRLQESYGEEFAELTIQCIKDLIITLRINPTLHIFLDVAPAILRERLSSRYGTSIPEHEFRKVLSYQESCKRFLSDSDIRIMVQDSGVSPRDVAKTIVEQVHTLLR